MLRDRVSSFRYLKSLWVCLNIFSSRAVTGQYLIIRKVRVHHMISVMSLYEGELVSTLTFQQSSLPGTGVRPVPILAVICHEVDSTRSWKQFSKISVYIDMMASHIFPRVVKCFFTLLEAAIRCWLHNGHKGMEIISSESQEGCGL